MVVARFAVCIAVSLLVAGCSTVEEPTREEPGGPPPSSAQEPGTRPPEEPGGTQPPWTFEYLGWVGSEDDGDFVVYEHRGGPCLASDTHAFEVWFGADHVLATPVRTYDGGSDVAPGQPATPWCFGEIAAFGMDEGLPSRIVLWDRAEGQELAELPEPNPESLEGEDDYDSRTPAISFDKDESADTLQVISAGEADWSDIQSDGCGEVLVDSDGDGTEETLGEARGQVRAGTVLRFTGAPPCTLSLAYRPTDGWLGQWSFT